MVGRFDGITASAPFERVGLVVQPRPTGPSFCTKRCGKVYTTMPASNSILGGPERGGRSPLARQQFRTGGRLHEVGLERRRGHWCISWLLKVFGLFDSESLSRSTSRLHPTVTGSCTARA